MSEPFKLEDDIPLDDEPDAEEVQIAPEPEVEDLPDPKWKPFIWRATTRFPKKCALGACRPQIGKCELCGDVFPCPSGFCGHADCADPRNVADLDCDGNGTPVPDWIVESMKFPNDCVPESKYHGK